MIGLFGAARVEAAVSHRAETPVLRWLLAGIIGLTALRVSLVFLFGLSQHQGQGTTVALLVPPSGLLAAWTYYRQGCVDLRIAFLASLWAV